jgi:CspA family cold shock protein
MPTGTVRLFNDILGNGFIDPDDGSPSLRVSYRSIENAGYKILCEGQAVTFDVAPSPRGLMAINVVITES